MPLLESYAASSASPEIAAGRRVRIFPQCSNPRCASGWLQLWRKRRVPVVEGGWLCSPECTRARMEELLGREQSGLHTSETYRHRVPVGLILLTRGWIKHEHLRDALEAQRSGCGMRLGEWLVANRKLDDAHLAHALGLQWSCPVFSLEKHGGGPLVTIVPRLLSESFGFVPLRRASSGILYLAFEDRIDHSLTLAIERVTGLRVESGLLPASEFRAARERHCQGRFARARVIEAGSLPLLAEAFAKQIEKQKPVETKLSRLRDLFWLRMWRAAGPGRKAEGEDVIGSVVRFS
jgi:hypothetical protein